MSLNMDRFAPKIRISIDRKFQFIIEMGVLGAVFILSYLLRFDFSIPHDYFHLMLLQLPLIMGVHWALLLVWGTYLRHLNRGFCPKHKLPQRRKPLVRWLKHIGFNLI